MSIKKTRPEPTGVPGIVQDGPDRYLVCARWTDPQTGRRRKKEKVATTLAEAVMYKEQLPGATLLQVRPTRQRFADCVEQWVEVHVELLAESTQERYIGALAHATVAFGNWYVDAIKPSDIRLWHRTKAKGLSNATVNSWLRVLRVVFDNAVEDGVLEINPARAVKVLPEGRTKGRRGTSLDLEEFRRFLNALDLMSGKSLSEDVARLTKFIAWTGVRKSEALAIKWDDLIDGELHVLRSVSRRSEKSTKTDDPRRITVVPPLAAALDEQKSWLRRTGHAGLFSGLIFPASPRHAKAGATRRDVDEVSWYRSKSVLDEPLRRVARSAEVPEISAQSLRRTWENLARKAGIDQLVRRTMAGWRTEKAQAIYAQSDRSEREEAGKAFIKLVMGGE